MINRVIHSVAGRVVRGLIGVAVFVQASQHVSLEGMLALALGAVIVITAGADVAPRPADSTGNA